MSVRSLVNPLDRLIAVFAPGWAASRVQARATMAQIESMSGTGFGGYEAGKLNRLTKGRTGSRIKESAVPIWEIQRLRWQAWHLYRNNPYARKVVRSITSKVIGKGMTPASTARNGDGSPFLEFRERALALWERVQRNFDYRGISGEGGTDTQALFRLMLRANILSGENLSRLTPISAAEMRRRGLPIAVTLQLLDADRLAWENTIFQADAALPKDHQIYRGIELDPSGRRAGYWLYDYPVGAVAPLPTHLRRFDADELMHLFVEEDIDQLRGTSWFAAALLQLRDIGDYTFNELTASAMAACVAFGFNRPTGAQQIGLVGGPSDDLVDDDGNPITRMQPGMIVNLGRDGKLQGFNPQRAGANVERFAQFMLRSVADGLPGTKASTITGDYRNSSFSSERSADNDAWPELEEVQSWMALNGYQPIWEKVIDEGVSEGWFDGVVSPAEYLERRYDLVGAHWQGPVARSINPTDDANSAGLRIKFALSSPQIECAKLGHDWRKILQDHAEFRQVAAELKIPDAAIDNIFSTPGSAQAAEISAGGQAGDAGGAGAGEDGSAAGKTDDDEVPVTAGGPFEDDDEDDDDEGEDK